MEGGMKRALSRLLSGFALACGTQFAQAKFVSEDVEIKTLVLLDNWSIIQTHSVFFEHL